jgi:hypothetical protein
MFDGESFDANDYVDFIVFAKIRSLLSKAAIYQSDTIQLGYSANFRVHLL